MINIIAQKQIDIIKEKCDAIKPLVAIDCITYNHELFIKETLEGFISQKTNFPFVAIVHDDASKDKTAEIIKEYTEKYPDIILPIYETENQYSKGEGTFRVVSEIMRTAIDATGAKYVALCEGDDYWIDPFKLQKQVDFLEQNPDYGMVYGLAKQYVQSENLFIENLGINYANIFELITKNYQIPTATILYKKVAFDQIFNKYLKDKSWQMGDYPLSLAMMTDFKIKLIPFELSVYRILEQSASHIKDYNKLIGVLKSIHELRLYFLSINNISLDSTNLINNLNRSLFLYSIGFKKFKEAADFSKNFIPQTGKEKIIKLIANSEFLLKIFYSLKK